MTIRERFERLQRYEGESEYCYSSVEMNLHPTGDWLSRVDVLALADELDKSRCSAETVHLDETVRCLRRAGHGDGHFAECSQSNATVTWWGEACKQAEVKP